MKNKLLVICGPTATGKTALALKLAKELNGEIISADSRQVYKDLNIGTGKDLPANAKYHWSFFSPGFYDINGIRLWGYDIANPKSEYSVSNYIRYARGVISDITKRNKLPILVGGTGFYIKGVVDGMATVNIPKNNDLRDKLQGRNASELFETLAQLDASKAGTMNISDKKNPRRLIRAIEIAQWKLNNQNKVLNSPKPLSDYDVKFIGLQMPKNRLSKIIEKRVKKRVERGIIKEVQTLIKSGVRWSSQSMNSLGYKEWRDYLEGKAKKDEVISDWYKNEIKYAKRQITWFSKDRRITWFLADKRNVAENVEKIVRRWYKE